MRRVAAAGLLIAALGLGAAGAQDAEGPVTALTSAYGFHWEETTGTTYGTASQNLRLGLTARWGQGLVLDGQVVNRLDGGALEANEVVNQLALTWNLNDWSIVTFGKQRLKWGTARVFSAIDDLQPAYDPANPQAVLAGVTGVKVELLPNEWLGFAALVLPAADLSRSRAAAQVTVLWEDWDLAFGGLHGLVGERHHWTAFADFSRFFDRFGVYGEAEAKNFRAQDWTPASGSGLASDFPLATLKATLGGQADLPAWMNGTIRVYTEYHYNGDGFAPSEATAFANAWGRRAAVSVQAPSGLTVGTFSRHYGYLGITGIPVTEKLTLSTSALAGLDTGFVLVRAGARFAVDTHLGLGLDFSRSGTVPGGATATDAVLLPPGNQVDLTVTASY